MSEEDQMGKYIEGLETELNDTKNKLSSSNQGLISHSVFNAGQDQNLIVFQLELDNILEKIEHLLRGDIIEEDDQGNIFYAPPKNISGVDKGKVNTDLQTLNEYGVQLVMNIISFYLNRNTILSCYIEDRIYEIIYDLGDELADLIYCNYEKMGMDTTQKKSRYPLLVISILHIVESTYNRALSGGERESLRSARVVTQNEPLGNMGRYNSYANQNSKKFSVFKPSTWI